MKCKITEMNQRVFDDRAAGMTYQKIAEKYGFSSTRARQHCKRVEWITQVETRRASCNQK
jgi:uncharacterized protein YjcR